MRELWRKLRTNRNTIDEDLAEELRFHLEERADELEAKGLPRPQALRQARLELGAPVAIREESKDQWSLGWIEDWYTDTIHAARGFARQPGFVLAAVLSFGLGIGVNLALFGIASHLIFRDPSVEAPQNLYAFRMAGSSHLESNVFRTFSESNLIPNLTGYTLIDDLNWRSDKESLRLYGIAAAPNYFKVTGTPVAQGRSFIPGEPFTTVISHDFWCRHLNSDPQVLGKPLWLNGAAHLVIGILPSDYRTLLGRGFAPDMIVPLSPTQHVQLLARFPSGTPRQQILDKITASGRSLDAAHPLPQGSYADFISFSSFAGIERLQEMLGPIGAAGIALVGAMFLLILFIACANVASLLLARTAARRQELALRSSLGATPVRLLRQLLAETLLLSFGGALAGITLYFAFTRALGSIALPIPLPVHLSAETNWTAIVYATLLAILAALASGLLPAWRASRSSLSDTLKSSEHQVAAPALTMRRWLLGAQIAASILLLSTGLLFLRNLSRTASLDPGFRLDTLWARMTLVSSQFEKSSSIALLVDQALARLRSDPRIDSAAFTLIVPFNDESNRRTSLRTEASSTPASLRFHFNIVSSNFFNTLGIPLIEGRELRDTPDDKTSIVVSASLARRLFGSKSPIGRKIFLNIGQGEETFNIVAVAGDTKHMALGEEEALTMYHPLTYTKTWRTQLDFMVRPRAATAEASKALRTTLLDLNSSSAITTRKLGDSLGMAIFPSQAGALVFGALGLLGLILSAVGLHGTVAFSVRQRSSEIGLRMALGATPSQVLGMIVRENAMTLLLGSIAGLGLAIAVAKPIAILLIPGIHPTEPSSIAAILLGIALVAMIAILGPARRAMRIDPLEALRSS